MDLATLGIRVDATGAIAQTKALAGGLDSLSGASSKLKGVMSGLAGIMGAGFIAHEFIANTVEAQDATAQLGAAIKSTGGAAGKSVADLQEYASMLQQTTAFSDDAVQGAQAMLLTFNKIQGANFDAATSAIADLSARMGTDLSNAAVQVGKALQDPANGLVALRKSGVSFSDAQMKVIKDLQETGHIADAQRMIIAELNREFGGAAVAARSTLGGALKGLKNDFGELFERTSDETKGLVSLINKMGELLRATKDWHAEIITVVEVLGAAGLLGAIYKLASGTTLGAFVSLTQYVTGYTSAVELAKVATIGLGTTIKTAILPLGAIIAAATAALYVWNKEAEETNKAIEIAEESNIRANAPALAAAKLHDPRKKDKPDDGPSDEQRKLAEDFKNTTGEIQQQIEKQRALNAVMGQSELTITLVTIAQEEAAKNRAIDAKFSDAQRAAIMKLNHALAQELASQARKDAAKKDAEAASKLAQANLQVEIALIIEATKRRDEQIAKDREAIQVSIALHAAKMKGIGEQIDAAGKERAAQQKYTDDMREMMRDGVVGMVTDFVKSWRKGFDDVLALAVKMMRRMEEEAKRLGELGASGKGYGALKVAGYAGAAIQGGMAGYDIGSASASGNKGSSALFGAVGGAASGAAVGTAILPGIGTAIGAAVGAIAGFVGGIVGAGHAADLSEREMIKLRDSLNTSVESIRATLTHDALGQALATLHSQFDAMRKAAEDAYAYGKNEGERAKALAEINQLEAERVAQIKAEAALVQKRAQEDLHVRELIAQGRTVEAEALRFAMAQQREYEDAVKASADATTLATLAVTQKAEADARAAAIALASARQTEDLTLRIMRAQNDPAYEEAARQAAERREIEDAIAAGASAATVELIKFAQAAESVAAAAARAAEETRAVEDINVELLQSQGKDREADDLAFKQEQERRYNEAVEKYGADSEYVSKLKQIIQNKSDQRAAELLIASTDVGPQRGDVRSTDATDLAAGTVSASVTERTAYALVDIGRQQLSAQLTMVDLLSAIAGGGGSGFGDVDAYLGSGSKNSGKYKGNVTI